MRHLSEGTLRRMYDEPLSLEEGARAHYQACGTCQDRFGEIARDARAALAALAVSSPAVDAQAALTRVKNLAGAAPGRPPRLAGLRGLGLRLGWRKPALAAGLAAGLAGAVTFTPLASDLSHVFQPTQTTTAVSVSQGDLQGLDAFSRWGTAGWTAKPELQQAESAAEAGRVSGLGTIHVDASKLPAGIAATAPAYAAMGQASGTVTFTAAAPKELQGTTLNVRLGPAETVVYGDVRKAMNGARGATSSQQAEQSLASAGPIVAVAKMQAPRVTSNGASVSQIKSVLLAQKGLSPALRAEISAIDSPTGNLPIPIPADKATAHPVTVHPASGNHPAVNGTAIGDNTGLGAGVVWIDQGMVYAVAGTISQDQALALARSIR